MLTGARTTVPAVPAQALASAVFPVDADGLVLGRDSTGRPVLLRMFDAVPRRVVFIGSLWAAEILVSRCLGAGAFVAVDAAPAAPAGPTAPVAPAGPTAGPDGPVAGEGHWLALGPLVTGTNGWVRPVPPNIGDWPATAARPVLRLRDVGPAGPTPDQGPPWHTELAVLSTAGPATGQLIADADVVLVQRLAQDDAEQVRLALRLGPDYTPLFAAMEDEMVAVFGGGVVRYAWLTPTPVERQLFG